MTAPIIAGIICHHVRNMDRSDRSDTASIPIRFHQKHVRPQAWEEGRILRTGCLSSCLAASISFTQVSVAPPLGEK